MNETARLTPGVEDVVVTYTRALNAWGQVVARTANGHSRHPIMKKFPSPIVMVLLVLLSAGRTLQAEE